MSQIPTANSSNPSMGTRGPLPEFARPPVVEVAISVQFAPLSGFHVAHYGELWGRFREELPFTQEHPPLARMSEQLPGQFSFLVMFQPQLPRVWFHNEQNTALVQFQPDRLVRNWRKQAPDDSYPRFESIFEGFQATFAKLEDFLKSKELPEPVLDQCEISYVNIISSGELYTGINDVAKLFSFISPRGAREFLPEVDGAAFHFSYPISSDDRTVVGRLHIDGNHVLDLASHEPAFMFSLTARGAPLGGNFAGASEFLKLGREWIVRGFAELTSSSMHTYWERKA